jgi:hypothetical protein
LRPFKKSEFYLKNDEDSWKIAYMKAKDNIEMIQKKNLFEFNNINKNDDDWNNSKSKMIKYANLYETNGWEYLLSKENFIIDANNPNKKELFTNTKEVEPYDSSYENKKKSNYTFEKNKLLSRDISQQIDECIPYEHFSLHTKQFNEEQLLLVYNILYKKNKYPTKTLNSF